MKLSELNIEELVELRTNMLLEKRSVKELNNLIKEKEIEYSKYLVEDSATGGPAGAVTGGSVGSFGVAMANAGIAGMGAVVSPQASSMPGATTGTNWSNFGGTEGSGDLATPFPVGGRNQMYQKLEMGKNHGSRTGKKSRVKKMNLKSLKDIFAKKQDYTKGSEKPAKRVMSFDDFQKGEINKITKVKQ